MMAHLPECSHHQRRFGEPRFEVIAQHVLVEKPRKRQFSVADREGQIAEPPHRKRVFVGDEAERTQACRSRRPLAAGLPYAPLSRGMIVMTRSVVKDSY
jgi:hypothetical protein